MTQRTALVSGCGNIGSRLLQSLARVTDFDLQVFGIEPFDAARNTSSERFEEAVLGKGSLSWSEEVPETVDLAVVACDASNRLAALETVLARTTPKAIVLEKILFTKPVDYATAQEKIEAIGAKCWVNTSRNVWPGYQELKPRLSGAETLHYRAEGRDWNLGSNAIHFLSVVEYLTDSPFTSLSFTPIGEGARDAKRAGYREVIGTLTGKTARGDTVELISAPDADAGIRVTIEAGGESYAIAEGPQTLSGPDGDETFRMLHASQLEETFVEILRDGTSDLPTLEESTRLHLLFFDAIGPALGVASGDEVPVT